MICRNYPYFGVLGQNLGYFCKGPKCSTGLSWKPQPYALRKTPAAIPPWVRVCLHYSQLLVYSILPASVNEGQLHLGRKMCAIPECLRGVFTTRHYTNSCLPYLTLPCALQKCHSPNYCYRPPHCTSTLMTVSCTSAFWSPMPNQQLLDTLCAADVME